MIALIAAVDRNNGIGLNGGLPWHLPDDLRHFKDVTSGRILVMGRKTFESLPGILPDRFHIVLTRNRNFRYEHKQVSVQHDSKLIMELAKFTDLFVIGGAEIFREFLPDAERIYLTVLEQDFKADVFFPDLDPSRWVKVQDRRGILDERNIIPHRFVTLVRRNGK